MYASANRMAFFDLVLQLFVNGRSFSRDDDPVFGLAVLVVPSRQIGSTLADYGPRAKVMGHLTLTRCSIGGQRVKSARSALNGEGPTRHTLTRDTS